MKAKDGHARCAWHAKFPAPSGGGMNCLACRKAEAAPLIAAAPNGGLDCGYRDGDDTTWVYYRTRADAMAVYARDGADVGPRESTRVDRKGQWYLTYRK